MRSMRYWYHPESDCVWMQDDEPVSDGLVEEVSFEEYSRLMDKQEKGTTMEYNAQNYQPTQGGFDKHPAGMYDFTISNTSVKATKDNDGGIFVVEFTSPVGKISNNYNLWNKSPQAVEIANKELSALCHATGCFRLSFPEIQGTNQPDMNQPQGAQLRGMRGKMEVQPQKNRDGTENGYMEVKRVFDVNGNDPVTGKPAVQTQQPGQQTGQGGGAAWGAPAGGTAQQAPMTQQPNGSWGGGGAATGIQHPQQNQPQQQAQPQGWQQPQQGNQAGPGPGQAAAGQPANTPPWGAQR